MSRGSLGSTPYAGRRESDIMDSLSAPGCMKAFGQCCPLSRGREEEPPPKRRLLGFTSGAVQILIRASMNMLNGKFGNIGSYGGARDGCRRSPGLYWLPMGCGPDPAPYVATWLH